MTAIASYIEFESEEEEYRYETISAGGVWAEIDEKKSERISVFWSSQHNQHDRLGLRLNAIGGKGRTNSGGYLPLSLTNCKMLRKEYGDLLGVGVNLDEWAAAEIERLGHIDSFASAGSDATLSETFAVEAPAIARVMHAYQRAGVAFCAATRRALLADQPGLGKTLQTLGTMVEAGIEGDILVAAPSAAVAITWPDELATWLPDDEFVGIMGTGPFRTKRLRQTFAAERTTKRRWIIVNLEMARMDYVAPTLEFRTPKNNPTAAPREIHVPGWYLPRYPELFYEDYEAAEEGKGKHLREWAGIVVDESHRCLVTHSTGAHAQTKVRAGMGKLALKEGGVKLALSGTPFRGKPQNLWGTLNWLYPERYSAYWDWVGRWFDVVGEPSQRPGADGDEQKREIVGLNEDLSAEFHADIAPIMLRRTKKEVRAELPDKLYAGTPLPDESGFVTENSPIGHWLEMSPKQARAYKDIQEKAYTEVESGLMYANGVFAEITRLKQFATCYGDQEAYTDSKGEIRYRFIPELPSAKFEWLVEFLDNLGINKSTSQEPDEDERKVVVASQFTSILNMFERELNKKGIATLKITGQVSPKQRKAAKDRWQEPGGPRVFLLNTAAGGVSLTLDMADDLVFLDETWIPDEQEQVEDRIHRVSRMHQVTIHYLRSLGTVEERIALTTSSRERLTKLLLDGERGIATAKKLLSPVQRPKS